MKIEKIIGNDDHAIVKIQSGESIMKSEETNRTEIPSRPWHARAEELHDHLEPMLREALSRLTYTHRILLQRAEVQSILELIELNAKTISSQNGSIARYQQINRHQQACLRKKQFDFEQAVKTNEEIREKLEQEQRVSQSLRNRCESLEKAAKSKAAEQTVVQKSVTEGMKQTLEFRQLVRSTIEDLKEAVLDELNTARDAIQDAEDAINDRFEEEEKLWSD